MGFWIGFTTAIVISLIVRSIVRFAWEDGCFSAAKRNWKNLYQLWRIQSENSNRSSYVTISNTKLYYYIKEKPLAHDSNVLILQLVIGDTIVATGTQIDVGIQKYVTFDVNPKYEVSKVEYLLLRAVENSKDNNGDNQK